MKEIEEQVRNELIGFYSSYIKGDKNIKDKAKAIYENYLTASTLLSEKVNQALNKLIDIYVDTGIKPISKDDAKKILEGLKSIS